MVRTACNSMRGGVCEDDWRAEAAIRTAASITTINKRRRTMPLRVRRAKGFTATFTGEYPPYGKRLQSALMRSLVGLVVLVVAASGSIRAQGPPPDAAAIVLRPARVFDGAAMHEGWAVRVVGDRIEAAGPAASVNVGNARIVELAGLTLTPGLVEGHSHVLLHPYNEAAWEFQVAHEPLALRTARGINHLRATLMAGFTTIRDLGTEGAGYADVGLRDAVDQGIIPGP